MKVVFLGDPYQCEQIVKERANSVMTRPIAESIDELFARMFPYRVVLRINKRSPQDSEKLAAMKHMLFEEKVDLKKFWKRVIEQGWIGGTLESDEDILRSGIGRHISYRNMTAIRINRLVHCDMYKQPYVHELFDGTHFLVRSVISDSARSGIGAQSSTSGMQR